MSGEGLRKSVDTYPFPSLPNALIILYELRMVYKFIRQSYGKPRVNLVNFSSEPHHGLLFSPRLKQSTTQIV